MHEFRLQISLLLPISKHWLYSVVLNFTDRFSVLMMFTLLVLILGIIPGMHCRFERLEAIHVYTDISLPGRVNGNNDVLKLVRRRADMTYQENLLKYIEELKSKRPDMKASFDDKNFAVVGSLATVDAAITLTEALQNINVIRAERAAGFAGKPNPTNDKLHNGLQQLNAVRNVLWLIKEKLKGGGSVFADKSLLEKLQEVQVYLSTQTGGHLGNAVDLALTKSGVFDALEAKWGKTSLKFRSFKAGAANFFDAAINGYNTVVNSLALRKEVTDGNILGLTSSVTALAGDIAMGVTSVIATASKAAGPIGYAIGATLYLVSYGTAVAQGIVSTENLETKDYVKIFLTPLTPDPSFGTLVDIIDQTIKGNYIEAYHLFYTRHYFGHFIILKLAISDYIHETKKLSQWGAILNFLGAIVHSNRLEEFKEQVASNAKNTVKLLKPKKVLFTFPKFRETDKYTVEGWKSESDVKTKFQIANALSPVNLFLATFTDDFKKPDACPNEAAKGYTFCPKAAPHGSDKLVFVGSDKVSEKILLDDDCEAYGLGGDDTFELEQNVGRKGVKIDGGEGSDEINTLATLEDSKSFLSGGGAERDTIFAGPGQNTIIVNNDFVNAPTGENTLIVRGKGRDTIKIGTGHDLVIVKKDEGSVDLVTSLLSTQNPSQQKPKRVVYESERTKAEGDDSIVGGETQFDVLSLRKYKGSKNHNGILLIEKGSTIDEYRSKVSDTDIFKNHPQQAFSSAQKIEFSNFERVEMSHNQNNFFFFKNDPQKSDYIEVTGGTKNDFVINAHPTTPLLAQLSTGDNLVFSGEGHDSFSVILDKGEDFIYDKGGNNILAVLLPKGVEMGNTQISRVTSGSGGYMVHQDKFDGNLKVQFMFLPRGRGGTVQIIVEDSTGRQVTFKPANPSMNSFQKTRTVGFYYQKFEFCPGDQDVLTDVEGIAPPPGQKLPQPMC